MSSENGTSDHRQWQIVMQTKVEEMHDDIHEIKLVIPKLELLSTLPEKVDRLGSAIEKLGDSILKAAIGSDRIPAKTFDLVVRTLCIIIGILGVAFAGAQGWFTKILAL